MVKITNETDPEVQNVHLFSEKIAACIREAFQANALHPASVVGVLQYHAGAVCHSTQAAFVNAPPQLKMPEDYK